MALVSTHITVIVMLLAMNLSMIILTIMVLVMVMVIVMRIAIIIVMPINDNNNNKVALFAQSYRLQNYFLYNFITIYSEGQGIMYYTAIITSCHW